MKKTFKYTLLIIPALLMMLSSCIEDGFSSSPSDQPLFSTDTLDMGMVFTAQPTPTAKMLIHNPHTKGMLVSNLRISGENARYFRINVDGLPGEEFNNIEIRDRDSIFVMVEATLPENDSDFPAAVQATLDVTVNGVVSSVVLRATGQDVYRIHGQVIDGDTRFRAGRPYQIYDSLTVAPGAVLTLEAGTNLCFHDRAMLIVRGTLVSEGIPGKPVVLQGDRTGNVVGDISFDIMSRQWTGVFFTPTSQDNVLTNTEIKNTWQGVYVASDGETETPSLTMTNCRLHNSAGLVLESEHASVKAVGCEFAEGGGGLVWLNGGKAVFNHCTFANNYLFAAISGPAIGMAHINEATDDGSGLPLLKAQITNSIIYGLGTDVLPGDLTGTAISFRRCLFKSKGSDDDNFIDCLWDSDPLYRTVRSDYFFDYRLQPDSPAIGAADASLTLPEAATDAYGLSRTATPDLGAYVFSGE